MSPKQESKRDALETRLQRQMQNIKKYTNSKTTDITDIIAFLKFAKEMSF